MIPDESNSPLLTCQHLAWFNWTTSWHQKANCLKSSALWERPGHSGELKSIRAGELADNDVGYEAVMLLQFVHEEETGQQNHGAEWWMRKQNVVRAGTQTPSRVLLYFKFVEKKRDFSQRCWCIGNWPAIRKKRLMLDLFPCFPKYLSRWLRDINVKMKSRDI